MMTPTTRRVLWLAGFLIAAGVLLGVLLFFTGCAAGFTEPDMEGKRAAMVGLRLGTIADAGSSLGKAIGDNLGSLLGLGAGVGGPIGILGVVAARLWASRAKRDGESVGWDQGAAAAHTERDRADRNYYEGVAVAGGPARGGVVGVPVQPSVSPPS